jgi:hypothetical protein
MTILPFCCLALFPFLFWKYANGGVFIYQMQLEKLKKSYQEEQVQGWRRDFESFKIIPTKSHFENNPSEIVLSPLLLQL